MEIKQLNDETKGLFKAIEDERVAGLMTYTWAGKERFIIDHTEVMPDFKGRGVGKILVQSAVEYARLNGLKIIPLCPFAKAEFDKRPEYADVLSV